METEIELKFFVSPNFSDILEAKLQALKVLQHSSRQLGNIYFDTPTNWLRSHDIGMRIRRCDGAYVQTVKTSGRVVAGLHQHPEYNAEHDCDVPKLSLHPDDIWPQGKSVSQLESELMPVFATDFIREQWLVQTSDGSQIEVAFDQGQVISGDLRDPICEVELELKSGQTDALFTLARSLSEFGGVRLGNLSKAARGYRLASGYQGDEVQALSLVETDSTDTVELCFVKSLEHGLAHWFYHEQIYIERDSIEALDEIRHAICFIRQTFSVYGDVVPRRASAIIRQELQWLEQEISWLKENDYLDDLLKDKGHVLRKLDERKPLVKKLREIQNKHPLREDNVRLLQSARYTGVIIDLSRWILAKGWQPFLDEKAKETMDSLIPDFAAQQLEHVLKELWVAFPLEQALSSEMCISQQYNLSRILYTGIGFASLYDSEARNGFRLPWTDFLQGIDDLLALKLLESLVESSEEQEQLIRWLTRQETSILYAMEQTRSKSMSTIPYWHSS